MLSSIFHLLPSTNLDIIFQLYIRLWLNGNNEKLNVENYSVVFSLLSYQPLQPLAVEAPS